LTEGRRVDVPVRRTLRVPDPFRVERCLRLPEFGPRLFFFSGGSALRETSRVLKHYTHNSIHLITPFDSGGSSAILREAFHILGVGDLRNRLMALADESELGSPEVSALFSHRLPRDGGSVELSSEFRSLVDGEHPLVQAVPSSLRQIIRTHLRKLGQKMPADFDLRGASVGNLILAGGYLVNQRDIESVLYLFSKLVSVRGTVRPAAMDDVHLVAVHESGERTVGQHRIGKPDTLERGRIRDLELTSALVDGEPVEIDADPVSLELMEQANLFCFSMGSFFGSILANLLPRGIGRGLARRDVPKLYVPNTGSDPEMAGYTLSGAVEKLLALARRDAGEATPTERLLDLVVVDSRSGRYDFELDLDRVRALGVGVVDLPLARPGGEELDPQRLVELLVSLA
jgi:CofD-related protein of GAK system